MKRGFGRCALVAAALTSTFISQGAWADAGIRLVNSTGFLSAITLPVEVRQIHCNSGRVIESLRVVDTSARFSSSTFAPAPGLRVQIINITPQPLASTPYTIRDYSSGAESKAFDIGIGIGITAKHQNDSFVFLAFPGWSTRNTFLYSVMKGDEILERDTFDVDVKFEVVRTTRRTGNRIECMF